VSAANELLSTRLEGFLASLGAIGIVPGPEKRIDFLSAIAATRPPTPTRLYWVARVTLLSAPEQIDDFDRVFAAWFGSLVPATVPPAGPTGSEPEPEPAAGGLAPAMIDEAFTVREGSGREASGHEALTEARFPPTSGVQAALLAEIEAMARRHAPRARGRRRVSDRRRGEELDLGRTARDAGRTAGEVTHLRWRRRPDRRRRVLLLIDVSGSLRASSPDALRCAHATLRALPRSEVYTFGTRLTRVTAPLRCADCDDALARVAADVADVNGGTRIGAALQTFLADARRASAARDALVIIVSDGLERGDPAQMRQAVTRLSRLAHRLVWWSPLARDPAYRPITRGMSAIVDRLDDLVGVDDLPSALAAVRRLGMLDPAPARATPPDPEPEAEVR
jgi:hypothetical protein